MAQSIRTEIMLGLDQVGADGSPLVDLAPLAARAAHVAVAQISQVVLVRRSLDARKGRPLRHRLEVDVWTGGAPAVLPRYKPAPRALAGQHVVIVGSGPTGTFAALRLAEAGAHVTVVERGKPVQPRRHDLAQLTRGAALDSDSNYCFGEGGAGTFSDGKLYTRVKDKEGVRQVLSILVEHGAEPGIEVQHRPHIGSNKLPIVLTGLRESLEARGVEYRFSARLMGLTVKDGTVVGAQLSTGEELRADHVLLAVGHSARDTYEWLVAMGVRAEPKPFAVGARIEHPQPLIDEIQYGAAAKHPNLPAAFYHVACEVDDGGITRGVYSFCMCPGGWVVDSATEPGRLATNGMSLKRRDSPFANAAMVVTVRPEDYAAWGTGPGDPLAGVAFQRALEENAFQVGGGGYVAPAQKLEDFLANRATGQALSSSYRPRVAGTDLTQVFPDFVTQGLRAAVPRLDKSMRGFRTSEAQLIGIETRTSAPLRFPRDPVTFESVSHARLYPLGEGAGYAGGIVSAAIDGLKAADAIVKHHGR